jgi:hypothetical protein
MHRLGMFERADESAQCNGGCPVCGRNDGMFNYYRNHYYACDTHRKAWFVGSNLYSAWRHETEEDWAANAERYKDYEMVDHPSYPVSGIAIRILDALRPSALWQSLRRRWVDDGIPF